MSEKFAALDKGGSLEFCGNKQPKCPHCGADFDIERNEAWFLYEDETHDVDCPSCGEIFSVNSIASWIFSTDEQERS